VLPQQAYVSGVIFSVDAETMPRQGFPKTQGQGGGEKQNSRVIWAAWGAWEEEEPVR